METNILWTGREYYSLENCVIKTDEAGSEISSYIVGKYGEVLYRVEYLIKTNANWETVFFEIKSRHGEHLQHLKFESNGQGRWTSEGREATQFSGCIDIDIPLTPFTNALPINRLKLSIGEEQLIKVMYLDLLEMQFTPVQQKYRRLSESAYHYENVPNDFEADITVDHRGFVVDYPMLFVRSGVLEIG